MVVQCSQMFANIKHSLTVFNEHLFHVCEDSSKCENVCVWLGKHSHRPKFVHMQITSRITGLYEDLSQVFIGWHYSLCNFYYKFMEKSITVQQDRCKYPTAAAKITIIYMWKAQNSQCQVHHPHVLTTLLIHFGKDSTSLLWLLCRRLAQSLLRAILNSYRLFCWTSFPAHSLGKQCFMGFKYEENACNS